MRAMSEHTRMNPDRRIDRLRRFNHRLQTTTDSLKVLKDWNMDLDQNLIEVQGRIISPQKIVFSDQKYAQVMPIELYHKTVFDSRVSAGDTGDWTRYFRDQRMLTTPSDGIDRWAVIAPERNSYDLKNLMENMFRAASGMGLRIKTPHE